MITELMQTIEEKIISIRKMRLIDILNEISLTPKVTEFLDTIQVSNNKIKDFRDIEVDDHHQKEIGMCITKVKD